VTIHVRLRGGAAPLLPLAGEWTPASFTDHRASLDLWPAPPRWDMARPLRNWAFESAAVDLAPPDAWGPPRAGASSATSETPDSMWSIRR
jgi:hypothetical protein